MDNDRARRPSRARRWAARVPSRIAAATLPARLVFLVLVALLPVVGLLLAEIVIDRSATLEYATRRAIDLASLGAEQQDDIIQETRTLLQVLVRIPAARQDPQACHELFRVLVNDHPRLSALALLGPNGRLTCGNRSANLDLDVSARPHIQRLLAPGSRDIQISEVTRTLSTGLPAIFIGIPLPPEPGSNQPSGAIIATLDLDWLTALSARIAGETGNVAVVVDTRSRTILARYPAGESFVGRDVGTAPALTAYLAANRRPGVTEGIGPEGLKRIYAFAPLPGTDGDTILVVGFARSGILADADRRMAGMLALVLATVLLAAVCAWIAAWHTLIKPIAGITETATRLGAGDLDARVTTRRLYAPELHILACTLNKMARDFSAAQGQLTRNEGKLLTYLDHLADGVVAIRVHPARRFAFEHANAAARTMLALPASAMGREPHEVWPAEQAAKLVARLQDCLDQAAPIRFVAADQPIADTPPAYRVLDVALAPVSTHHGATGIELLLCSVRDITRETELEAQLLQAQRMEAVGQLTAGVAHDFNNMLQAQMAGLELLLDAVAGQASATRYAEMAIEAGEKGAQLTHSLLAFSRQQVLRPEPIRLHSLLDRLEALLSRTLEPRIALRVDVEADLPPPFADPAQLESALLNLCLNARDAMQDRGGRLQIEASMHPRANAVTTAEEGDWIVLAVSDEGCGIPADMVVRVCEPFFTTKDIGKGSGLGLSMVQGFARQSGGELKIQSWPGTGTRVEIWLPRATLRTTATAQPVPMLALSSAPHPTPPPRNRTSGRVLLVDDDAGVRDLVGETLENAGFTVIRAASGEQAAAALRAGLRFDALVTDYAMPGMTGGELVQAARQVQPQLPALVITGYAETTELGEIPPSVDVLHKPFRAEELSTRVTNLIERAAATLVPN